MHKAEMFRMGTMAQMSRCYTEAMEEGGLIEIPTGEYTYFKITMDEASDEELNKYCDDIPEEFTEEKEYCEQGHNHGGNMLVRIGRFESSDTTSLHVDICEGEEGSETLMDESTYSSDGTTYTATVRHSDNFFGESETMLFALSATGLTVDEANKTISLGSGTIEATGNMSGKHGSGIMVFGADGSGNTNYIKGGFDGSFEDPMSGASSSFSGKVYSKWNLATGDSKAKGSAKYSYTGSTPPMKVSDMIPWDVTADELANFLSMMSIELGIQITTSNYQTLYLCPNDDYDYEAETENVKPMVAANDDNSCPSITEEGVESFEITTASTQGDYGTQKSQAATKIDNSESPTYDEVNAFDLADISAASDTGSFSRNWDCSGVFTEISLDNLSSAAETAMNECKALEEKAYDDQGMSEYNCFEGEGGEMFTEKNEQGTPDFGNYGGDYQLRSEDAGTTCAQDYDISDVIWVDPVDITQGIYCLWFDGVETCDEFTVTGTTVSENILYTESIGIIGITYSSPTKDGWYSKATITFDGNDTTCDAVYEISQPNYTPNDDYDPENDDPNDFFPQACLDAGLTTEQDCHNHCQKPGVDCSDSQQQ